MEVKLCDFGFARMIPGAQYDAAGNRKKPEDMTVYVSTRWYRAPEVRVLDKMSRDLCSVSNIRSMSECKCALTCTAYPSH